MTTGKIGKITVAVGFVILVLILLKLFFIESIPQPESTQQTLIENKQPMSLIPDFAAIKDISAKKQAFFDYLRPAIRRQNALINDERQFLQNSRQHLEDKLALSAADQFRIETIADNYRYSLRNINPNTLDALLTRVDIIPESMVLIQAANETGWGSSRFAREGLNFFGQWCFRKGCGLVPQSRTSGKSHEVAVYKSVEDSVASYIRNLNSNAAYRLLRSIRADLRAQNKAIEADKLVYGLINYSERQQAYIDELLDMLRHNKQFLVENYENKIAV